MTAHHVRVRIDSRDDYTPTPVISHAILRHNRGTNGEQLLTGDDIADGIVITPSHNPPTDGGFKYDPPSGGPAGSDVTSHISQRANELLSQWEKVPRLSFEEAIDSPLIEHFDYRQHYVEDLKNVIDFDIIRSSGVRLGIDPLGGASVHYWPYIA